MDKVIPKQQMPEIDFGKPLIQVCTDKAGRIIIFNKNCTIFEGMQVLSVALNILEDRVKREAIVRPNAGFDPRNIS